MVKKKRTDRDKQLIRRYLIWCYKTTKEDLDRIDRYFTQFEVDTYLLKSLRAAKAHQPAAATAGYRRFVDEFETYLKDKHRKALGKKFADEAHTVLDPQYEYLRERLLAVEGAIVHFLGRPQLNLIRRLYEEEMTSRILTAREHT